MVTWPVSGPAVAPRQRHPLQFWIEFDHPATGVDGLVVMLGLMVRDRGQGGPGDLLGGDPDRPVIAGVVPTMVTPSPVTKANRTRNVIQTGGRNRIEIEGLSGAVMRLGQAAGVPTPVHRGAYAALKLHAGGKAQ